MTGERVYTVAPNTLGDLDILPKWRNRPPGPRVAGPYSPPFRLLRNIGTGFPTDMPKPLISFSRTVKGAASASTPIDEAYNVPPFWLMSERLKATLFGIDPEGFDSVAVEVRLWNRSIGPSYHLLEPLRVVDCYDYAASKAEGARIAENGAVNLGAAPTSNVFLSSALNGAPFFSIPRNISLCTEVAREAVLNAGHTNLSFHAVGWLR